MKLWKLDHPCQKDRFVFLDDVVLILRCFYFQSYFNTENWSFFGKEVLICEWS